ncbi:hypothetical protein M0638_17155 [Roseomonas sp. NAR14]|uniref:Uncharacterized protein n=1 Tax=Roseomonas acroporae TaxID=2937791 RepID=A0A9X2BYJ8_9PROT|nr:hypothetical protein [Roseomonas acroporae]MCK8786105.1 hypothetical protein [Roseomonas acroporae]
MGGGIGLPRRIGRGILAEMHATGSIYIEIIFHFYPDHARTPVGKRCLPARPNVNRQARKGGILSAISGTGLETATMRKVVLRLVPFLMICHFFSLLDRSSIGVASSSAVTGHSPRAACTIGTISASRRAIVASATLTATAHRNRLRQIKRTRAQVSSVRLQ